MKAIVLKTQVKRKGEWTPLASRIFDVNDNVVTDTLAALFEPVVRPNCRVLVEERKMRHVPGAPVHIEDLWARMSDYGNRIRQAMSLWRTPGACEQAMAEAQTELREWAETNGLKIDWSKRE